jgi:hypothetical protein
MAVSPRPSRAARLSASVEKAFGEDFRFEAFTPSDDVNGRYIVDVTRATVIRSAIWRGPVKSFTPKGRGSASDDRAHNFTVSFPTVNVQDALMPWTVQMGDKITRIGDGNAYQAGAPYADGHGRTTIPLTSRVRPTLISATANVELGALTVVATAQVSP